MRHPKQCSADRDAMIDRLTDVLARQECIDLSDERAVSDVIYASGEADDYAPIHVDAAIPEIIEAARVERAHQVGALAVSCIALCLGVLPLIATGGINP